MNKLKISFILLFFVTFNLKSAAQSTYDKLNVVAIKLNKSMPQYLDEYTRINSLHASSPDTLKYYGTIFHVNNTKESIMRIKEIMENKLLTSVKTEQDFKPYRDNKVKIVYLYYDEAKKLLFKIFLTPDKYLK